MAGNQHGLLIVYTSKNGRTGAMVEPIRQGMLDGGASVEVRTVEEVQWDEMLAVQGIIVGTPVRFGDVDWQIRPSPAELNHGMVVQGNAHSSYYGPVALRESSRDEVVSVCNTWGRHWADLVQRLYGSF